MTNYVIPKFEGDYFFLSNFYSAPISFTMGNLGTLEFPTNEHAFQAAKYKAMRGSHDAKLLYVSQVCDAENPGKSKYLGRSVDIDPEVWDAQKINVMREVCFEKFRQHTDLRDKLLATGAAMLVEGNDWNDKFWGRCEGKGYNLLGSILMEIRGYFLWNSKRDENNHISFEHLQRVGDFS